MRVEAGPAIAHIKSRILTSARGRALVISIPYCWKVTFHGFVMRAMCYVLAYLRDTHHAIWPLRSHPFVVTPLVAAPSSSARQHKFPDCAHLLLVDDDDK